MGWIYILETAFALGLLVNAALFIPQAIKLYHTKDPTSLSLWTFAGFNIIQWITIGHAIYMKDYLLAMGNVANFLTSGTITVLILFYTFRKKMQ